MEPPPAVASPVARPRIQMPSAATRRTTSGRLDVRSAMTGLGLVGLVVASVVGWVLTVTRLDPRLIDDIGLISVLPPYAFVFLGLLSVSFVLALSMQKPIAVVLTLHVAALALMVYGAPAMFEEMPRFPTAWLHAGFSDAIGRTGELYPLRDARFDWPGFFTLAAFLNSATGYDNLLGILAWVPPVIMLLYLAPLYVIFRAADADIRLTWLAIWFFYLVNWVGQDYFAPQAFNILLLLASIAVVLTWFHREPGPPTSNRFARLRSRIPRRLARIAVDQGGRWRSESREPFTPRQQVGLVAMVVVMFGASVASHQLTPFAMLGGVIGLTLFRRIRLSGLSVLMIVLLGSWLMFMSTTYLAGHLANLLEDLGRPDQIAASNVGDRLAGSAGHLLVVQARLGLTIGVWALALIGGLRRIFAGHLDLTLAILAVAPFGLVLLQAYGGEMLLRVYLFSSPFMAFFAAAALIPTRKALTWRTTTVVVVLSVALAGMLLLTRYGNEKAEQVTIGEYQVLEFVSDAAQPRDTIGSANHSHPIGYFEWEEHNVVQLGGQFRDGDITGLLGALARRTPEGRDTYFVITRGQRAYAELFWDMTDADWDLRVRSITRGAELLYENPDGAVYRFPRPTGAAAP